MKKNVYFIILFLLLIDMGCSKKDVTIEAPIITGKIEKAMLLSTDYPWFEKNYNEFLQKDDREDIFKSIKEKKDNVSILVFMGTWCGDSKREIPRFYKIMDKSGFSNFQVYGLDRKKKSPDELESKYKIERVPTFIFFKNDKEIGRIVETPVKTLEEDIQNILEKN